MAADGNCLYRACVCVCVCGGGGGGPQKTFRVGGEEFEKLGLKKLWSSSKIKNKITCFMLPERLWEESLCLSSFACPWIVTNKIKVGEMNSFSKGWIGDV